MKFFIAFSALLALPAVLAAECGNTQWGKPNNAIMTEFWRSREAICYCVKGGGSASACRINNSLATIEWWGNQPSEKLCWDATENIFNECTKNGEFTVVRLRLQRAT